MACIAIKAVMKLVGALACIIVGVLADNNVTRPAIINLGGMFDPISVNGVLTVSQAEHLAAFTMAIKEINDKTDGVYDDVLPSTQLAIAVRGSASLAGSTAGYLQLEQVFSGEGVVAVVNALPNENALLINQISTEQKTPQILSVADSAQFYEHSSFPYVSRTIALQAWQGVIMSQLLCAYFDARKIVTITSTQVEDILSRQEFIERANCTMKVLADVTVTNDQADFTDQIATAKASGGRYFVAFLPASQLALLLEQGYEANLFHQDTVVLTSSRGSTNITSYFSPGADVPSLMQGFFSMSYWPNYHMNRSTEAFDFARRWRSQPSTAGVWKGGQMVCDNTTDDEGSFYLYRSQGSTNSSSAICTGLDFSTYTSSGLDIQPSTALTYDATMLLAQALHFAIENGLDYQNPAVLMETQVYNVSYTGVTGHIVLMHGFPKFNHNGRGGRKVGNFYNITNFNKEAYLAGRSPFVNIGYYNGDSVSFHRCAVIDGETCFAAEFSGAVGGDYSIPPSDTPPPIFEQMSAGLSGAQKAMGVIVGLLVVVFFVFIVTHRHMKMIKSSQPALLYSILVGGLIAAVRVFIGGTVKNNILCMCEFWTGHLAFVIIIGSLFVKAYRVHCIVNTKTLRRVKFSTGDAVKLLSVIVGFTVVFLMFASAFGRPRLHHHNSYFANQNTIEEYCSMNRPHFQTALFAVELVLLLVAFWVCWETRNVPDIVNESKVISTGKLSQFVIGADRTTNVFTLHYSHVRNRASEFSGASHCVSSWST
jgi:ABC-type branched-subunit amino acid transport system substrate-binding protein